MAHLARPRGRSLFAALSLASLSARAGVPPLAYLYEPLDQGRDRERVGERRAGNDANALRASAYLSLGGHVAWTPGLAPDYGAMLVLQLPFDRLAAGASSGLASPPRGAEGGPSAPGSGISDDAAPLPLQPLRAPAVAEPLAVSPVVARACVAAAFRAAGVGDDGRLEGLASRARASAALPELRLRASRTVDESGRVTLSEIDPSRYTQVGGDTYWLEARLTFRLDRLLFADEEVSLERIRMDRTEARARVAQKALRALFDWQKALLLSKDPNLGSDDHFAAVLGEIEAAALLDVLTDGWFGRFRAGVLASK